MTTLVTWQLKPGVKLTCVCVCVNTQVNLLGLEEHVENDPCKFVLWCRGSSERFTLQAANTDIKQVWVQHITDLLDLQSNFLSGKKMPRPCES